MQRQQLPPGADRVTQRGPLATGRLEQAYFVFREEDEIAVRICADTAFFCRRAEASERFQSSLVIVLKSGSVGRAREGAALDAGVFSGEGIVHESAAAQLRRSRREKQRVFSSAQSSAATGGVGARAISTLSTRRRSMSITSNFIDTSRAPVAQSDRASAF